VLFNVDGLVSDDDRLIDHVLIARDEVRLLLER
jgi:hypothetical protein